MKKQYVAPEIEIIEFDVTDIITHSLATDNGDNATSYPFGNKGNKKGTVDFRVDGNNIYTDFGTFGGE